MSAAVRAEADIMGITEPYGGGRFLRDYFHFERPHVLTEVISGLILVRQPSGLGSGINLMLLAPPCSS